MAERQSRDEDGQKEIVERDRDRQRDEIRRRGRDTNRDTVKCRDKDGDRVTRTRDCISVTEVKRWSNLNN